MSVRTRFLRKRWSIFCSVQWWSVKSGFIRQVNNSFCAILIWSVKVAVTNRLYFHSAPWHCLTAVNIDVICEGPGHTKADPRRLDRSMGHHVRRLVLLQHKHRSCLRVSPPSLSANCGRYFAKSGDTGFVFANTISHHTSCWAWDFSPGELGHQSICFVTYENTQDVTKFSKIVVRLYICPLIHVFNSPKLINSIFLTFPRGEYLDQAQGAGARCLQRANQGGVKRQNSKLLALLNKEWSNLKLKQAS